jgi:ribosomal protein L11 methyltransferase
MAVTAWLEVCLCVDGELAEAVAEVLARFAPEGVVIESTAVTANADDSEGHAVGPLRVCAYLPADENLEDSRQRLEKALWYLGRIRPLPEAQYQLVQQADWAESWKQYYHPVEIGERLMIVPAWLEIDTRGRVPVHIDPGMAFGTGTHPTTQLCLELLEEYFRDTSSGAEAVIDVGCGSGILAVAALKLGAMHALGVDLDAEAVNASRQNAALNGVAGRLEVGLGSVTEIRSGAFTLRQAPLVLANILAPVIVQLMQDGLAELLAPGGSLVLSGILAEQCEDVEAALQAHGLRRVDRRQEGDWVALLAQ